LSWRLFFVLQNNALWNHKVVFFYIATVRHDYNFL
jgi:hypothetical protein